MRDRRHRKGQLRPICARVYYENTKTRLSVVSPLGDTFPYVGAQARQSELPVNRKQGIWGDGMVVKHPPV